MKLIYNLVFPYKYNIGDVIPYYENRRLKIIKRERNFRINNLNVYTLESLPQYSFSESLITFYLKNVKVILPGV